MRKILLAAFGLGLLAVALVLGMRWSSRRAEAPRFESVTSAANLRNATSADRQIRRAEAVIGTAANRPEGYNLLALAYMQKARETGDFGFNAKAKSAIQLAFERVPGDLDALTLQAGLLVAEHRFHEAAEAARRALQIRPDHPDALGSLSDALLELGDYRAAIDAAQKMMDLRPDLGAYARVSYIRALHGDIEGAIEAMRVAIRAANPREAERVAWCHVQLGNALLAIGKSEEAERGYESALAAFPDYYLALAARARAYAVAGDYGKAAAFYERAQERVPSPDLAIALGDLYSTLRRSADATRQFALAEFLENRGANASSTDARQQALYLADHGLRLEEALEIARLARASRNDIYTCDTLAWCLFKAGQLAEAKVALQDALRLGTRDARLRYHAGMIFKALGDTDRAQRNLRSALSARLSFDNAHASFGILQKREAERALQELRPLQNRAGAALRR